jgi:cardiolipin synthase
VKPPEMELVIGGEEFWRAARQDILAARDRVLVQSMTFEGDAAGWGLAHAMIESAAPDRRVLVDRYTAWIQSDQLTLTPNGLWGELSHEVGSTRRMLTRLREGGVGAQWSNPEGPLLMALAGRNHKKVVVADDVTYVGGINFSDHNFEWHDLMLRIDHPDVADLAAADTDAAWNGTHIPGHIDVPGLELLFLDGRSNTRLYAPLFDLLARARDEIIVHGPYVTFPFVEPLADAARRGVHVKLVTARDNNVGIMRRYVAAAAATHGFDLRYVPDMSHLKAMLVDGTTLVLGSCNFNYVSYASQQETLAFVTDPDVVEDVKRRVFEPDLDRAMAPDSVDGTWSRLEDRAFHSIMRVFGGLARVARGWRPFFP